MKMFGIPLLRDPVLRRLSRRVVAHSGILSLAAVAMIIAAATEPLLPKLTGLLVDEGLIKRDASAAVWIPASFVGLFIARGLAGFASSLMLSRISQAVLVDLRAEMFEKLLVLPMPALEEMPSGVVITKFVNEASNALNAAAEVMTVAIRDSVSAVFLVCLLFYYNWSLTLTVLLVAPIIVLALRLIGRRMRRLSFESQVMMGELARCVQEAHDGGREIRVYGAQSQERERFAAINHKLRRVSMKMQVGWSGATPVTQVIAAVGLSVVFSMALWQARAQVLSAGEFVTFITAALMLLAPLRHLAALSGPIARMMAAGQSVFSLLDSIGERETGRRILGRAKGKLEFKGVSFAYAGAATAAVDSVSLEVHPGETIALVGPSGAGKTTLINMLPRFIEPSSGKILIDDVPIDDLTRGSLRAQMALVSQNVFLFDDTVGANIAFGASRGVCEAQILAAADAAFLMPLIESLPDGLATRIGENAVKLSGGQRQRLSIARAILKDAPILLLDEATSALDSDSERYVQLSLEKLMKGRTTIVVAHRLSTIEHADRIVVMEKGRVIEQGPHAELISSGGLYAHLYRTQFRSPSDI
jgi:subfamily B ATP-binding cassette protein MsbA